MPRQFAERSFRLRELEVNLLQTKNSLVLFVFYTWYIVKWEPSVVAKETFQVSRKGLLMKKCGT
jgi:hypothetical protein